MQSFFISNRRIILIAFKIRRVFEMKKESVIVAKVLKEVSRKAVQAGADSRCMFVLHQPKMPSGIKKMK